MARNSEKRLSGLNRFLEAKETVKNSEHQRPPLILMHGWCNFPFPVKCRLSTADEVKGWIPSIQKEINYLLTQIEGTGSRKHQDSKVKEFRERIEFLEQEHKRFVAKVRSLDPSYRDVMPWQPRAYSRKRGREGGGGGGGGKVHEPQAKKLFSPLLAGEKTLHYKMKPPSQASESQPSYCPKGLIVPACVKEATVNSGTGGLGSEVNVHLSQGHTLESSRGGRLGLDYSSSSDEECTS